MASSRISNGEPESPSLDDQRSVEHHPSGIRSTRSFDTTTDLQKRTVSPRRVYIRRNLSRTSSGRAAKTRAATSSVASTASTGARGYTCRA